MLETIFAPQFEAVDLVNLGFAQIYLTLMIDGVGSQPFSARTLPPLEPPAKSHKFMVIKRSQQNYSRPRAEVEQAVIDSHSPEKRIESAVEAGGGNKGGFTKPSGFHKVGTDKAFVKQKEQLKNGGSIKRGPAQTPPGTKSGGNGQKNQSEQSKKEQSNQTPRFKKPVEKTPDDLRAILAGMTGEKKPENKEGSKKEIPKVAAAPTQTTEKVVQQSDDGSAQAAVTPQVEVKKVTTPQAQEQKQTSVQSRSVTPNQTQSRNHAVTQDKRPTAKTPDDLRAVLAKMTESMQSKDQKDQVKPVRAKSEVSRTVPSTQTTPHTGTNNTESLKSALSGVLKKVEPNQNSDKQHLQKQIQPLKEKESDRRVIQKESEPVTEQVSQSPQPPLGGVRKPAFEHYENPVEPDISTVKKMLKTSGKDRPPGM